MANPAAEQELHATVEHDAGADDGAHATPVAFGFIGPAAWVGLAMLVFIAILLWKGVPKLITRGLDAKIAAIREQLDEAKALRAEAEALRAEYAAKVANAEKDDAAIIHHDQDVAAAIGVKSKSGIAALIARCMS